MSLAVRQYRQWLHEEDEEEGHIDLGRIRGSPVTQPAYMERYAFQAFQDDRAAPATQPYRAHGAPLALPCNALHGSRWAKLQ